MSVDVGSRVYVDMVGDLFHAGHVAFLREARRHGDWLIVGVLSDDITASYKRRPIMTLAERVAVIESCRYVDEVIADSPDRLTEDFIDEHRITTVVHGDDLSLDGAESIYGPAVAAGNFVYVPRAGGISTTQLINGCSTRPPRWSDRICRDPRSCRCPDAMASLLWARPGGHPYGRMRTSKLLPSVAALN